MRVICTETSEAKDSKGNRAIILKGSIGTLYGLKINEDGTDGPTITQWDYSTVSGVHQGQMTVSNGVYTIYGVPLNAMEASPDQANPKGK